jgi:putative hydrolase of HD superfamily
MTPREYLNILHTAERLKDTMRHSTTSGGRVESVGEHSWRVSLMAFLLKDVFPEADIDKVIRMCLIHDLGECFTGDIPVFAKTDADTKKEDQLLRDWVDTLPRKTAEEMNALYDEMDALETTEAKIYKALDKLEALIQHNEAPISTWEDHEYSLQQTYAWPNVEFSKWLKELRGEVLKDTLEKIEEAKS